MLHIVLPVTSWSYRLRVPKEVLVVDDLVRQGPDPHPHAVPQFGDPPLHPVKEPPGNVQTIQLQKHKEVNSKYRLL